MDWKSVYNNAFPTAQPFSKYSWPKGPTDKAPAGPAGAYQGLAKPGPSGESSFPELKAAGPWAGGNWPELQASGMGDGSTYPKLPGTGPSEGSSYPSMRWVDHVGDFSFRIEIEGKAVGHFSRVEGLTMNVEVIEYQHSDDIVPRKRMGRIKVDNVRLVKGYVISAELFKWCEDAMKGDVSRKSMSVILLADDHLTELTRYNLYEVWPVKWSGFKLDGKGQGALVEEIELAVEEVRGG